MAIEFKNSFFSQFKKFFSRLVDSVLYIIFLPVENLVKPPLNQHYQPAPMCQPCYNALPLNTLKIDKLPR